MDNNKNTKMKNAVTVGGPVKFLPNVGSNWLSLMLANVFPGEGTVIKWEYFCKDQNIPTNASVWRKVPDGEALCYELIGYNELPPAPVKLTKYIVQQSEQIHVKRGDIIGVHYSVYNINGAIANALDDQGVPEKQLHDTVTVEVFDEDIDIGDRVDFEQYNFKMERRTFSLAAILQPYEDKTDDIRDNKN